MRSSGRVRLPDVAFVSIARVPEERSRVPTLAPDLAAEVLSESNTREEIAQKIREYFQSGTRLVWVIDPPTRSVAVYENAGQPQRTLAVTDVLEAGDVLPGFSLPVADLFRNVPPPAAPRPSPQ
jgi:Uma2 family endonuclease